MVDEHKLKVATHLAPFASLVLLLSSPPAYSDTQELCKEYRGEKVKLCEELTTIDTLLNDVYQSALSRLEKVADRDSLRNDQKEWIKNEQISTCGTKDLPTQKLAWYRALLENPKKADCVIWRSKIRILRLRSTIPGLVEKIPEYSRTALPEYLRKHAFMPSGYSGNGPSAPYEYCRAFLENLAQGKNIEHISSTGNSVPEGELEELGGTSRCNLPAMRGYRSIYEEVVSSTYYDISQVSEKPESGNTAATGMMEVVGIVGEGISEKFMPRHCKFDVYNYKTATTRFYVVNVDSCEIIGTPRDLIRGGETFFDTASCNTAIRPQQEWTDVVRFNGKLGYYSFSHGVQPHGELVLVDPNQKEGWSYCEFTTKEWLWTQTRPQH
jgi:uncharacterized protein YecT (DUF1311 family)